MVSISVKSIQSKVVDSITGSANKYLDAFSTVITDDCTKLGKQNSIFDFLSKAGGLSRISSGLKDVFSKGLVDALANSPLRQMAEDALAENINRYSRTLVQNALNIIPEKLTRTLKDLRSVTFNAVYATIAFQNNMPLFFTMKIAEECVEAIRDKRHTLICLKGSVIKLHNALMKLTGSGPFFNEYLKQLRKALAQIDQAEKELTSVQSNFYVNGVFIKRKFEDAKELLDAAFVNILPPASTSPEKPDQNLLTALLAGLQHAPTFQQQLTQLMTIPKFVMEMLGSYDLYVVKVLKVNTLLTGFLSSIQGMEELVHGKMGEIVIDRLSTARAGLRDIIGSMGKQINGGSDLIYTYKDGFIPNASLTSSKAIEWGVRVKTIRVLLDSIDPSAVETIQLSNAGLVAYNVAVESLGYLNNRITPTAILRADAGREEIGDIEGDILAMAVQSNLAILGMASLSKNKYDSKSVLSLGVKLEDRIELSIIQDRQVEMILLRFIQKVGPITEVNKNLGNSIYKLLDDLGMDRASDMLKKGAWKEFFSLTGKTANYIGAAMTGLNLLLKGLSNEGQRQCVSTAINKLATKSVATKLEAERSLRFNYTKQQQINESKCQDGKALLDKVKGCTAGIDIGQLTSYPFKSLQGAFRGVFGGDITDSIMGTFGNFGEISTTKIAGIPLDISSVFGKTSGVFNSAQHASMALKESILFSGKIIGPAVAAVKSAATTAQNAVATATGAVSGAIGAATGAVSGAIGAATGAVSGVVGDLVGGATGAIGDITGSLPESIQKSISGALGDATNTIKGFTESTLSSLGEQVTGAAKDALNAATSEMSVATSLTNETEYLENNLAQVDNPFDKLGEES